MSHATHTAGPVTLHVQPPKQKPSDLIAALTDAKDLITVNDISALRNEMPHPIRTSLNRAPTHARVQVQNTLKLLQAYEVHLNGDQAIVDRTAHVLVSTFNNDVFTRMLYHIVMMFVDVSTSDKLVAVPGTYVYFNTSDDPMKSAWRALDMGDVLFAIKQHVRYRPWARNYALAAYNFIKHHDYSPALATKWGFTPDTKNVAFDFADAIPIAALTNDEIAAISAASRANTFTAGDTVPHTISTNHYYTQGTLHAPVSIGRT
jgi:hypothetical protein